MPAILFEHATVVTMSPFLPVISPAYVVVEGAKIVSVASRRQAGDFDRVVDCTGLVMMPGLINAHTHLPMSLLRGYGGGCDLHTWLNDYIFPVEAKLDSRCVRAGTALSLAELIASGVTCVADMYFFCDDIAQVVAQSGLNANLSRAVACPEPVAHPADLPACREMDALVARWHGYDDGRILIDAALHAEYTSFAAPNVWRYLGDYAAKHDLGMHVHISETQHEHQSCLARHGHTPLALLDQHGLFQNRGMAAHCVWVTEQDMALMAAREITALHNPGSNLKLSSGVAPVAQMLQAGVNVALGTDGVASNNSHDLFGELKLAATLHQTIGQQPNAITARQALAMATVNGATALGRTTGLISAGYDADLILLDFTRPGLTPCHDPEENLVFSARGSDVVMNMTRGKIIYEKGEFTTLDLAEIRRELSDYALPRLFAKDTG